MTEGQNHRPERRQSPRIRVVRSGKVVYLNLLSVIDCTVRDISEGGARLACHQAGFLPEEFLLVFLTARTMRQVRVIWRRLNEIGVQYLSDAEDASRLRLTWSSPGPFYPKSGNPRDARIVLYG